MNIQVVLSIATLVATILGFVVYPIFRTIIYKNKKRTELMRNILEKRIELMRNILERCIIRQLKEAYSEWIKRKQDTFQEISRYRTSSLSISIRERAIMKYREKIKKQDINKFQQSINDFTTKFLEEVKRERNKFEEWIKNRNVQNKFEEWIHDNESKFEEWIKNVRDICEKNIEYRQNKFEKWMEDLLLNIAKVTSDWEDYEIIKEKLIETNKTTHENNIEQDKNILEDLISHSREEFGDIIRHSREEIN